MIDEKDLVVVHIENRYASGERKRPRGPRSSKETSQVAPQQPTLSFTPVDLNSVAVTYYARYHMQPPSDNPEILKSMLHCILPRWTHNDQYRMLELAVTSKALATFSRTQNYPPAAVAASSKYRELLLMAHETITHIDKENVDACLIAIFFMSRYEGVIYPSSQHQLQLPFLSTLQSFVHHDGAFTILKIWKYRFSHVQPPSDIVKLTRRGLIRSALLRGLEIPHWMLDGDLFGERGLDLEFDRIVVQIVNIRHRLSTLSADPQLRQHATDNAQEGFEELCRETQETDEILQQWAAGFPTLWSFTQHTLSNDGLWSPQKYFYSPTVYSYSNPAFAGAWANYYATRMLVLSTWITILEACRLNAGKVAQDCHHSLECAANDLASSLPFCLQRFNKSEDHELISLDSIKLNKSRDIEPYLVSIMIWPLSLASSLKHVEIKQQCWFKSVLAHLGRVIGVSVFEYATTDRWPML